MQSALQKKMAMAADEDEAAEIRRLMEEQVAALDLSTAFPSPFHCLATGLLTPLRDLSLPSHYIFTTIHWFFAACP